MRGKVVGWDDGTELLKEEECQTEDMDLQMKQTYVKQISSSGTSWSAWTGGHGVPLTDQPHKSSSSNVHFVATIHKKKLI